MSHRNQRCVGGSLQALQSAVETPVGDEGNPYPGALHLRDYAGAIGAALSVATEGLGNVLEVRVIISVAVHERVLRCQEEYKIMPTAMSFGLFDEETPHDLEATVLEIDKIRTTFSSDYKPVASRVAIVVTVDETDEVDGLKGLLANISYEGALMHIKAFADINPNTGRFTRHPTHLSEGVMWGPSEYEDNALADSSYLVSKTWERVSITADVPLGRVLEKMDTNAGREQMQKCLRAIDNNVQTRSQVLCILALVMFMVSPVVSQTVFPTTGPLPNIDSHKPDLGTYRICSDTTELTGTNARDETDATIQVYFPRVITAVQSYAHEYYQVNGTLATGVYMPANDAMTHFCEETILKDDFLLFDTNSPAAKAHSLAYTTGAIYSSSIDGDWDYQKEGASSIPPRCGPHSCKHNHPYDEWFCAPGGGCTTDYMRYYLPVSMTNYVPCAYSSPNYHVKINTTSDIESEYNNFMCSQRTFFNNSTRVAIEYNGHIARLERPDTYSGIEACNISFGIRSHRFTWDGKPLNDSRMVPLGEDEDTVGLCSIIPGVCELSKGFVFGDVVFSTHQPHPRYQDATVDLVSYNLLNARTTFKPCVFADDFEYLLPGGAELFCGIDSDGSHVLRLTRTLTVLTQPATQQLRYTIDPYGANINVFLPLAGFVPPNFDSILNGCADEDFPLCPSSTHYPSGITFNAHVHTISVSPPAFAVSIGTETLNANCTVLPCRVQFPVVSGAELRIIAYAGSSRRRRDLYEETAQYTQSVMDAVNGVSNVLGSAVANALHTFHSYVENSQQSRSIDDTVRRLAQSGRDRTAADLHTLLAALDQGDIEQDILRDYMSLASQISTGIANSRDSSLHSALGTANLLGVPTYLSSQGVVSYKQVRCIFNYTNSNSIRCGGYVSNPNNPYDYAVLADDGTTCLLGPNPVTAIKYPNYNYNGATWVKNHGFFWYTSLSQGFSTLSLSHEEREDSLEAVRSDHQFLEASDITASVAHALRTAAVVNAQNSISQPYRGSSSGGFLSTLGSDLQAALVTVGGWIDRAANQAFEFAKAVEDDALQVLSIGIGAFKNWINIIIAVAIAIFLVWCYMKYRDWQSGSSKPQSDAEEGDFVNGMDEKGEAEHVYDNTTKLREFKGQDYMIENISGAGKGLMIQMRDAVTHQGKRNVMVARKGHIEPRQYCTTGACVDIAVSQVIITPITDKGATGVLGSPEVVSGNVGLVGKRVANPRIGFYTASFGLILHLTETVVINPFTLRHTKTDELSYSAMTADRQPLEPYRDARQYWPTAVAYGLLKFHTGGSLIKAVYTSLGFVYHLRIDSMDFTVGPDLTRMIMPFSGALVSSPTGIGWIPQHASLVFK